MERTRLLAGRYRFLRLLPGRAKGATWMALDEATGASVVASILPSSRATALQHAVGLKHERLASIVEIVHKLSPDDLPENTDVPKDAAVGVAEWLPGRTLHERVKSTKMPPFLAVQTVVQVASVLSYLHEQHVAHGALSARAVLVERADSGPVPALTQVLVPPDGACFAPERVRGAGPSESDDAWALHVMLFMALTGERPFTGASAPDLARAIVVSKFPPLASHGIDDATLQGIFERGFGPITKRHVRVDEVASDLTMWLTRNRHLGEALEAAASRAKTNDEVGPPTIDSATLEAQMRDEDSYNSGVNRAAAAAPPPPPPPDKPAQPDRRAPRPGAAKDAQAAAAPPVAEPALYSADEDDKTELINRPLFAEDLATFGVIEDASPADAPPPRGTTAPARPQPKPAAGGGSKLEPARVVQVGAAPPRPAQPPKAQVAQHVATPAKVEQTAKAEPPPKIELSARDASQPRIELSARELSQPGIESAKVEPPLKIEPPATEEPQARIEPIAPVRSDATIEIGDPGDGIDQAPTPALPEPAPFATPKPIEPASPPAEPLFAAAEPQPEVSEPLQERGISAAPPAPQPARAAGKLFYVRVAIVATLASAAIASGAFFWFRGHPDASMAPQGSSAASTKVAGSAAPGTASVATSPPASAGPIASASAAPASDSASPTASAAPAACASPSSSAAPAASASPTATTAPAASASTPASGAPVASGAAAKTPAPAGASACVASYFPPETFAVQQDLGFVCEEPDPRKGTPRMRARIVMGSRGVLTPGMDEWARLGWYELVVWATLRAGCCPGVPVIEIPESEPPCDALGPPAERTARALVAHQQTEAAEHLAAFEKGAMCMQFQEKKLFKYTNPPRSGGQLAFNKFVARALARQ